MGILTGEQAVAKALQITTGYGGMCLAFTQVCYNAPHKYPSAIASWNASQRKVPQTDPTKIPRGYPVYFAPHGTPWGHVGVSLGNGEFRSTNSGTNRITTDAIKKWVGWGYRLLGYTLDISDIPIVIGGVTQDKQQGRKFKLASIINDQQTGRQYYYTPETGAMYVAHPDIIKQLDAISVYYTGKPLPRINSTAKAPWLNRMSQLGGKS